MKNSNYIVVHKNEWKRIKNQAGPLIPEKVKINKNNCEDITKSWEKTWQDSSLNVVARAEAIKENKRLRDLELIKTWQEKEKKDKVKNLEVIHKAREIIFENTSYGRQLLSALYESKAIEEREAQIKFHIEKEHEKAEKELEFIQIQKPFIDFGIHLELERERNAKTKEIAEINKTLYEKRQEKIKAKKQYEKEMLREDNEIDRNLIEYEDQELEKCKEKEKQLAAEYRAMHKEISERRALREEADEALANAWQRYQDRVRKKEKLVFDQIHKEREKTPWAKHCYNLIKNIEEEKSKAYDKFIESGIRKAEQIALQKQFEMAAKEQKEQEEKLILAKQYKAINDSAFDQQAHNSNRRNVSERQTLYFKSKPSCACKRSHMKRVPPHFESKTEKLENRRKQPSPWSGTEQYHKLFAEYSAKVLDMCQHKQPVIKVIDDYRKTFGLDSTTLPMKSYNS